MPFDLTVLERGDELTIESAHPFPTRVRHIKHDDEGHLYIKTGNDHQGQELHEEDGDVVLYEGLDKTRLGPVSVSRREGDLPVTELQEGILWYAHGAKGVSIPAVRDKFDVSEQEAHEACMALGERNLLSFWTHRGYWSIYEEGENWLAENSDPPVEPYPCKHNRASDDGSRLNTYGFIKTMQRDKKVLGEYNGDMIGFDPDDPGVSI
jgi:hypothetical protein